jgi:hypothetical protein
MKTYVAEINGEAVMAFRATDDDDAHDLASDEDGDLQQSLNESSGIVREDGSPLWDGKSKIRVRPATEAEDEDWRTARDAEIKDSDEGELIDSEIDDGLDDFSGAPGRTGARFAFRNLPASDQRLGCFARCAASRKGGRMICRVKPISWQSE